MAGGKAKTTEKQIVEPTEAPLNAGGKFRSAKFWGKRELELLEVVFEEKPRKLLDLNTITNTNVDDWPAELQKCISPSSALFW